ncbi:Uncharacterised protein [Mycobacteroides abscessus]|nr:Uncharacterised protein [Mycobacteroides abscessus]SHV18790.1 Uncharacterised protein [Mycobacteroides abscessus subsp. abscessus]
MMPLKICHPRPGISLSPTAVMVPAMPCAIQPTPIQMASNRIEFSSSLKHSTPRTKEAAPVRNSSTRMPADDTGNAKANTICATPDTNR